MSSPISNYIAIVQPQQKQQQPSSGPVVMQIVAFVPYNQLQPQQPQQVALPQPDPEQTQRGTKRKRGVGRPPKNEGLTAEQLAERERLREKWRVNSRSYRARGKAKEQAKKEKEEERLRLQAAHETATTTQPPPPKGPFEAEEEAEAAGEGNRQKRQKRLDALSDDLFEDIRQLEDEETWAQVEGLQLDEEQLMAHINLGLQDEPLEFDFSLFGVENEETQSV